MKGSIRGYYAVKTILALVIAIACGLVPPPHLSAASLTLVMADPGRSFGRIEIGKPAPFGWDVHCHFYEPYLGPDGLWVYPHEGLVASAWKPRARGVQSRGLITDIDQLPRISYRHFGPADLQDLLSSIPGNIIPFLCRTGTGDRASAEMQLPVPENLLFATTKGVHIGSSTEDVIGAYHTPQEASVTPGVTDGFLSLRYCGIWFSLYHGLVDSIGVSSCSP